MKTDNEYFYIHQHLVKTYGKADRCSNPECESKNPKRFEWALLKGRAYSRDITDYVPLCPSCHRKYDYTDEQKAKMSKAKIGNKNAMRTPVQQLTKEGVIIASFDDIVLASRLTKTNRTSISSCLTGRYKTANNFIWKRLQTN